MLVFIVSDVLDEVLNAFETLLLLLRADVQLVNLLDDELLDLLLHDWRLLFDNLLRLSRLFLDEATVLSSQLPDKLLNLALLLPLVSLISQATRDIRDEFLADHRVAQFYLSVFFGCACGRSFLVELCLLEVGAREVEHWLEFRLFVLVHDIVDPLLQVLPSQHDVLEIGEADGHHGDGGHGTGAIYDLIHGQAADLIEYLTARLAVLHNDRVFVLQSEEHFNLAVDQDVHFVVILILNKDVLARLEYLVSEHENQLLVGLNAQVAEIVNIQQHHLLPAAEAVLVLNEILLHSIFDIWEDGDDLVEGLLGDVADVTVTFRLNRRGPPVV